jgi:hypothetical protein
MMDVIIRIPRDCCSVITFGKIVSGALFMTLFKILIWNSEFGIPKKKKKKKLKNNLGIFFREIFFPIFFGGGV